MDTQNVSYPDRGIVYTMEKQGPMHACTVEVTLNVVLSKDPGSRAGGVAPR